MIYIAILIGIVIGVLIRADLAITFLIKLGLIVVWFILFALFIPICLLTIPLVLIGVILDFFQCIGAGTMDIKFSVSENFMKLPARVIKGLDYIGNSLID